MPANPPDDMPRVSPYLLYENLGDAISWLSGAFGLAERMRIDGPDGNPNHAELTLCDGVIMAGQPGSDYRNPKRLGGVTQHLYVYVDDVDAHCARARAAGATILEEPADTFYGDRRYAAVDPEGHQWYFATHVRDVPPEEMQP